MSASSSSVEAKAAKAVDEERPVNALPVLSGESEQYLKQMDDTDDGRNYYRDDLEASLNEAADVFGEWKKVEYKDAVVLVRVTAPIAADASWEDHFFISANALAEICKPHQFVQLALWGDVNKPADERGQFHLGRALRKIVYKLYEAKVDELYEESDGRYNILVFPKKRHVVGEIKIHCQRDDITRGQFAKRGRGRRRGRRE